MKLDNNVAVASCDTIRRLRELLLWSVSDSAEGFD